MDACYDSHCQQFSSLWLLLSAINFTKRWCEMFPLPYIALPGYVFFTRIRREMFPYSTFPRNVFFTRHYREMFPLPYIALPGNVSFTRHFREMLTLPDISAECSSFLTFPRNIHLTQYCFREVFRISLWSCSWTYRRIASSQSGTLTDLSPPRKEGRCQELHSGQLGGSGGQRGPLVVLRGPREPLKAYSLHLRTRPKYRWGIMDLN